MRILPMEQARVHLHPVTGYVQDNQQLPYKEPCRVEEAEAHKEACCGTSVGHHVQHRSKAGALNEKKFFFKYQTNNILAKSTHDLVQIDSYKCLLRKDPIPSQVQ